MAISSSYDLRVRRQRPTLHQGRRAASQHRLLMVDDNRDLFKPSSDERNRQIPGSFGDCAGARSVYNVSTSWTVFAGLWERDLIEHLNWNIGGDTMKPDRPDGYGALPWSWASFGCQVQFKKYSELPIYEVKSRARVLSAQCSPSTLDPHGQVSGGHIELETTLYLAERQHSRWVLQISPNLEIKIEISLDRWEEDHMRGNCPICAAGLEFGECDGTQSPENGVYAGIWSFLLLERSVNHYVRVGTDVTLRRRNSIQSRTCLCKKSGSCSFISLRSSL
ncbi:MAG: hypothetical protein M1839_004650 [Geoglossum umbratile]|nr:MAG: hypothetical protein M1839_004650 [Geoglossum umbratile]